MPKPLHRQSARSAGFTLVESIISSLILAIAILGAASQYVSQLRAEATQNIMMQSRILMEQAKQRVISAPSLFPNASNAGDPFVYVICFNDSGSVVANQCTSKLDYVGVKVPAGPSGLAALKQPMQMPNDCPSASAFKFVCPMMGPDGLESGGGGIEVHVAWSDLLDPKKPGVVTVDSLILPSAARAFGTTSSTGAGDKLIMSGPILHTEVKL